MKSELVEQQMFLKDNCKKNSGDPSIKKKVLYLNIKKTI